MTDHRFEATVFASVGSAAYLTASDRMLWIAKEGLPAHARALIATPPLPRLRPGTDLHMRDGQLVAGDGTIFDLTRALGWWPRDATPGDAAPMSESAAAFKALLAALEKLPTGRGLGAAIPIVAAVARGLTPDPSPALLSSLLSRAARPIAQISAACLAGEIAEAASVASQLISLGEGLTPSGDDFVGGMLFALRRVQAAYPTAFLWKDEPFARLLEDSRQGTNRISYALLEDLAAGEGAEPLHDLIASLLKGHPEEAVRVYLPRVLGIGHSSGHDLLAGALVGMLSLLHAENGGADVKV